ncbi:MAG: hypothetical protein KAS32_29735, partial [Candidatus Peribacteraceae bacterium]|nr:hypothetical protein [Candidatus Peribacteraceae bacterium]
EWRDEIAEGASQGELTSVGADLGSGSKNSDETTFAKMYDGKHIGDLEIQQYYNPDIATMETAGIIKGLIDAYSVDVFIDSHGLGLGCYQRLIEQGYDKKAHAFVAPRKAPKKMKDKTGMYKFGNLRAAAWWRMRELLDPEGEHLITLPRNDKLTGELTAPKKNIKSDATLFIEMKKDIRKRLGRSTDHADAVIQAATGEMTVKKGRAKIYVIGEGYVD